MKKAILTLAIICSTVTAFSKTYTVRSAQDFKDAAGKITAGDVIAIANGTYKDWAVTLSSAGTLQKPVIIKPENAGMVTFTGEAPQTIFTITGKYVVLEGMKFTGCRVVKSVKQGNFLVDLNNSTNCRVTGCDFTKNEVDTQFTPIVVISGTGDANRVDHCSFIANINNQEVQVRITKDEHPVNSLIDHNLFKDKDKVTWKVFNGGECIQIGQDPVLQGGIKAYTTVRNNHFIRCNGEPEVISNKSSDNRYIANTFDDCEGELVMRGGHDCLIDSNVIAGGSCGIRVNGTGHTITNNKISNVKTGIRLMYGMARGKEATGFYIAADHCLIKNNALKNVHTGILIGDSKNTDWTGKFDTTRYPSPVMQNLAPADNRLDGNTFENAEEKVVNN